PAGDRAGGALALYAGAARRRDRPGAGGGGAHVRGRRGGAAGRGGAWGGRRGGRADVPALSGAVRDHVDPAAHGAGRCRGARKAENLMPEVHFLGESLALSGILFTIGVAGVLLRRNAIVLFMCIEIMLNAVNLVFVAFAQLYGVSGYIMVFFVMTVAAAEAAVGLAIILAIFRHRQTVDLQNINLLRG